MRRIIVAILLITAALAITYSVIQILGQAGDLRAWKQQVLPILIPIGWRLLKVAIAIFFLTFLITIALLKDAESGIGIFMWVLSFVPFFYLEGYTELESYLYGNALVGIGIVALFFTEILEAIADWLNRKDGEDKRKKRDTS